MVQRTREKTNPGVADPRRMLDVMPGLTIPLSEIRFRFSRSGGAGGQHVNKVSTRVQLLFDVQGSPSLSDEQRALLLDRVGTRLDREGSLSVVVDASRSQWKNREEALQRLLEMLRRALAPRKRRRATRTTAAARERRLQAKKLRGRTKAARRGGNLE